MKIKLRSVAAPAAALLMALMLTACGSDGGQSLINTSAPDQSSSTPAGSTSETVAPDVTPETTPSDTSVSDTSTSGADTSSGELPFVPAEPTDTTTAAPITTTPNPDTAAPDDGWTDFY